MFHVVIISQLSDSYFCLNTILHTYLSISDLKYLTHLPSFSSAPMIDPSRLENVLPACLYSPTYVVKDFPIARYQGLQFVSHHSIDSPSHHSVHVMVFACMSFYN